MLVSSSGHVTMNSPGGLGSWMNLFVISSSALLLAQVLQPSPWGVFSLLWWPLEWEQVCVFTRFFCGIGTSPILLIPVEQRIIYIHKKCYLWPPFFPRNLTHICPLLVGGGRCDSTREWVSSPFKQFPCYIYCGDALRSITLLFFNVLS